MSAVVDVPYVVHASHGRWISTKGVVLCACGAELYRSRWGKKAPQRRLRAAVALDRAVEAQRSGYSPPAHYRALVEALHERPSVTAELAVDGGA